MVWRCLTRFDKGVREDLGDETRKRHRKSSTKQPSRIWHPPSLALESHVKAESNEQPRLEQPPLHQPQPVSHKLKLIQDIFVDNYMGFARNAESSRICDDTLMRLNADPEAVRFVSRWEPRRELRHIGTSRTSVVFTGRSGMVFKVYAPSINGQTIAQQELRTIREMEQGSVHGVTKMVDSLESDSHPTITVMDNYGTDMRRLIGRRQLTGPMFIDALASLPKILDHMHRHGWKHGDINPSNMMFDGLRWRLIDFGFSRHFFGDFGDGEEMGYTEATDTNGSRLVLGTLPFILPEMGHSGPSQSPLYKYMHAKGSTIIDPALFRNADRYALSMCMLYCLGWPTSSHSCDRCLGQSSPCTSCTQKTMRGVPTKFMVLPVHYFLRMRSSTVSCIDGRYFAWPCGVYPYVLEAVIHLLLDFVFQFMSIEREFCVWDVETLSCDYYGAATSRDYLDMYGAQRSSPDEIWQELLRLVEELDDEH